MSIVLNELPDQRFHVWSIDELYFGTPPTQEVYRPRVNDMVIDRNRGIAFVSQVSAEGIPTLEWKLRFKQEAFFNEDSTSLITALSHYQPNAANRAYFNESVYPYTIEVDGRWQSVGSEPVKMIFFLGTELDPEKAVVISEVYNSSGDLVGNEVPLVEVTPGVNTKKRPNKFNTTRKLKNGEVITGVAYKADGGIFTTQPFYVTEDASVYPADPMAKFITGITLASPLLSKDDDRLIENIKDTPFSTALVKGVLHYSDGSETTLNIDGVKMVLHGLDQFDTSRIGRPSNLVLSYYPGPNEPFVNGGNGSKAHLSEPYRLANIAKDTAYVLKVFLVPTYVDGAGYQYRWMMTNIEGDLLLDVTDFVIARLPSGQDISGTDYGTLQDLTVAVEMNNVAPGLYPDYVHTQRLKLTVSQPGTTGMQPWMLDYVGDSGNVFGSGAFAATNDNGDVLNVSSGSSIYANWLTHLYYSVEPMYDYSLQDMAGEPTHFIVEYQGIETGKVPVADWNQDIAKPAMMAAFAQNATATIRWVQETPDGDRVMGWSPLIIKNHL